MFFSFSSKPIFRCLIIVSTSSIGKELARFSTGHELCFITVLLTSSFEKEIVCFFTGQERSSRIGDGRPPLTIVFVSKPMMNMAILGKKSNRNECMMVLDSSDNDILEKTETAAFSAKEQSHF